MSEGDGHEVASAFTLDIDIKNGTVKRIRNFKPSAGGVAALPLEKKLRDTFMGIAGLAEIAGDQFSATVVENKAEELAYGWARVAQENEKVRIAIRWIVETNAWTDAMVPTVMVTGSIGWRYGLLPDSIGEKIAKFSGAVPMTPEEEAQLQKQAEQMQAMMNDQAAASEPVSETEPETEDNIPSTDSPRVVPIPLDAELDSDS